MIITSSAVCFLPWWKDWYNILRKFSFSQFQSWFHYLVLHSQAKKYEKSSANDKGHCWVHHLCKVCQGARGLFISTVSRGRLLGRRCPHITREMCSHLSLWRLTAWRKFFSLQDFGCCFTRSSVCGRVDQRTAINRRAGDVVMEHWRQVYVDARWCLVGNVSQWFCLQIGLCKVTGFSPQTCLLLWTEL